MSIQPLPDHVIAQIKSSTTITSLNGVICGLAKNSLDAGASKINISVDYARGNCSIEDNGTGILPAEFNVGGGLGLLHYTSRFPARPEIHGRSGTFLASVAALSLLSVTSHHQGHRSHNSIKIHNSDILERYTPSPPDQRLLTFGHGTRVTVRDLFGLMPVRVKQRAIAAVDKILSSRDWENLKHDLAALLLAWPGHVAVSIRDSVNQQSSVIKGGEPTTEEASQKGQRPALVARIPKLLCQAGLSDESSPESWIRLKATAGAMSVDGAVCISPVATKRVQFISFGIQPVSNERGSNVLYEEINRLFANSSFGVEEQLSEFDEAERNRRAEDGRYDTTGYTENELKAKRGIDRWPMFYVRIILDGSDDQPTRHDVEEVLDERRPSLRAIIDVLRAMVYEFLKKHHFRPVHYKPRKNESPRRPHSQNTGNALSRGATSTLAPRPASQLTHRPDGTLNKSESKTPVGDLATTRLQLAHVVGIRSKSESPFDLWTRVKSGRQTPTMGKPPNRQEPENETENTKGPAEMPLAVTSQRKTPPPLLDSSGKLLRAPFLDVEETLASGNQEHNEASLKDHAGGGRPGSDDEIIWVNPATKQKSIIDARTGFMINAPGQSDNELSSYARPSRLISGKRLQLQAQQAEAATSPWLRELLSSWTNPVFEAAEPRIPVAFDETKFAHSMNASRTNLHSYGEGILDFPSVFEGRVSKQALGEAEVVAQVDRKFIFAKVPLNMSPNTTQEHQNIPSLLVIVDQHAADERCRVETLMKDYFKEDTTKSGTGVTAQTDILDRALQYEVSCQEYSLFERYSSHFGHWGIVYQLAPKLSLVPRNTEELPSFLKVLSLPSSISERCRTEPRLLIDLLRKEVWKLDGAGRGHPGQTTRNRTNTCSANESEAELHWLSRFHGCPQGILDMINSRACRSAIMFNDVLTHEDCKDLLRRLASCAFPFQCAHGRPSMVPLVDMGDHRINMSEESDKTAFRTQFKRWKASMEHKSS